MQTVLPITVLLSLVILLHAEDEQNADPQPQDPAKMTLVEEASYLVGVDMGMRAMGGVQQFKLDIDLMTQGLRDALEHQPLKSNYSERYENVLKELIAEMKAKMAAMAEVNLAKGKAYLDDLKSKSGITFTDSGIAYEVIKASEGATPTASDEVVVHYRGTLITGEEFDSSYRVGKPFPVSLLKGGVIPGWLEALRLMQVGSKYRFHIPSDLAYGPAGSRSIEPNSVLVFEIELLEITGN